MDLLCVLINFCFKTSKSAIETAETPKLLHLVLLFSGGVTFLGKSVEDNERSGRPCATRILYIIGSYYILHIIGSYKSTGISETNVQRILRPLLQRQPHAHFIPHALTAAATGRIGGVVDKSFCFAYDPEM